MVGKGDSDILGLLWETFWEKFTLSTTSGEKVTVSAPGELNPAQGLVCGASIKINDTLVKGDVVLGGREAYGVSDYAVLQIVSSETHRVLDKNGERIPQVVAPIREDIHKYILSLKNGVERNDCGYRISSMESIRRAALYEKLAFERLARKCGDIMNAFRGCEEDWAQTFHITLFRAMAGSRNSEQYRKLASIATYSMILRERSSAALVEALLLGSSGLLEGVYYDDYIHLLRNHFEYLRSKYNITPMRAHEWNTTPNRPAGGIIVRLVQLASFLAGNDFLFDRAVACRTRKDIHTLFSAEASDYWTTHYRPDKPGNAIPKRIGMAKADLLGINLIIPVMFAYGDHTRKELLKEAAIALYDKIPPENNKITNAWTAAGAPLKNSMDAQAILQLNNEYCTLGRCTECRIGKSLIKKYIGEFKFR